MAENFAVIGVGGYIAPRHLKAIRETGNRLVAAVDPIDSVGVIDQYSITARFFREFESFEQHLDLLRRTNHADRVSYVAVCSPNYLHAAHARAAMLMDADVICEKPLTIDTASLDALEQIERDTGRRVNTVLQLRVHPKLKAVRETLAGSAKKHEVMLTYITARGDWYMSSWKADRSKSGGVATNIGIHLFDMLLWLFGAPKSMELHLTSDRKMAGFLELERARIRWYLSIDAADLPADLAGTPRTTFRSVTVDGEEIEFTEGFTDLHTTIYELALAGQGFRIADARPSIELVEALTATPIAAGSDLAHPFVTRHVQHVRSPQLVR